MHGRTGERVEMKGMKDRQDGSMDRRKGERRMRMKECEK